MQTEQVAKSGFSYLIMLYVICFTGAVFGGIASTLMSSYLPVAVNDLLSTAATDDINTIGAIINSIFIFGMLCGGILIGMLGDKAGRKISVLTSIFCIGFFMLLTSLAHAWWLIIVCRFFTGFGVGGILVSSTIIIAEEWVESKRNIALGILSITIPVGIFSAGIITYFFENWRDGFLIGIIPILLSIATKYLLKESDKWKTNQAITNKQKKNTISIFQKDSLYNLIFGCIIYATMLIGLWAIFLWLPTWVQSLVKNSDGQKERGLSMMVFAIGGISGGIISGWITKYLGMKKIMLICFAATFLMSFILFKLNESLTIFSYMEMGVIARFFGISQGALNVYIPELFPVSIRSSATGFCFNIGRVFTGSAVFFVGWMVSLLGGYGNALFLFSFVFLIGFIATVFAKEKELL